MRVIIIESSVWIESIVLFRSIYRIYFCFVWFFWQIFIFLSIKHVYLLFHPQSLEQKISSYVSLFSIGIIKYSNLHRSHYASSSFGLQYYSLIFNMLNGCAINNSLCSSIEIIKCTQVPVCCCNTLNQFRVYVFVFESFE